MDSKTLVNVGEQRLYKLIEENKFYIDKTEFIREWWETGSTVTLITRPRRFGKTLNRSIGRKNGMMANTPIYIIRGQSPALSVKRESINHIGQTRAETDL